MLNTGTQVTARLTKGNSWVVATISEKGKLTRKKSIAKLADVKDKGFITLASYLKIMKSTDEPQSILEALDCTSLYVHYEEAVNPDSRGTKNWEKLWWKTLNPYCLGCTKRCKQSDKVSIVVCGQYVKVK